MARLRPSTIAQLGVTKRLFDKPAGGRRPDRIRARQGAEHRFSSQAPFRRTVRDHARRRADRIVRDRARQHDRRQHRAAGLRREALGRRAAARDGEPPGHRRIRPAQLRRLWPRPVAADWQALVGRRLARRIEDIERHRSQARSEQGAAGRGGRFCRHGRDADRGLHRDHGRRDLSRRPLELDRPGRISHRRSQRPLWRDDLRVTPAW